MFTNGIWKMSSNDIYNLADGWLELESDPGLFTLLLEDMGVPNVQVEEIYDLQSDNLVEGGDAYGFILLFRWIEDRRSRRKLIEEESHYLKNDSNSLFFAQQMVPNSCATHALVSIMLNCPRVSLGETLSKLKMHVSGIDDSETKGWAIGNCPELALAHNSHAAPRARRRMERGSNPTLPSSISRYTGETFHFVSYVPHDGHLIELDGLKKWPIDHGMFGDDGWIEKFRKVIIERLGMSSGGEPDIRFALMAVVPDKKMFLVEKLKLLNANRSIAINALHNIISKHGGNAIKQGGTAAKRGDSNEGVESLAKINQSEEIAHLEKQVEKVIEAKEQLSKRLKAKPLHRMISKTDSFDSSSAAESPFQSNPLLLSHDYAKSPLMEGLDDNSSVSEIDDDETEALKRLEELKNEQPEPADKPEPSNFDPKKDKFQDPESYSPKELLALLKSIDVDIKQLETNLKDEHEKRRKHKIDDCRRVHDYDEFITTFVSMLAEQNILGDLLEHALNIKKPQSLSTSVVSNTSATSSGSGNNGGGSSIKKLKVSSTKSSSGISSKNRSKSRGRPKKKY